MQNKRTANITQIQKKNNRSLNRALPVKVSIIRPKSTVCFGQQLGNSEPPYICGIWGFGVVWEHALYCTVLYLYCRWQSAQTGCLLPKKRRGRGGHCPHIHVRSETLTTTFLGCSQSNQATVQYTVARGHLRGWGGEQGKTGFMTNVARYLKKIARCCTSG